MGVWYKQLGLLLWKNFLIQSRRKLSTLFEILLPIFFVLILLILRITTIKSKHHDDPTLWKPFQMNRTIPLNKNPDSSSIPNIVNRNPYMDNKPFYTVKKWSIAYAPNNSETRFIMSNLKTFLDANVDAFESPEEMIKNVVTDEDQPIASQAFLCAVTFTSKQGAKQIEYDLRFPTSARSTFGDKRLQKFGSIVPKKWYTQFIYPITFPGINPRNEFEDVGGPPPYYHEGFLSVQNAVNMAIIKSKAKDFNETLYDIQLQRFPYPDGWRDNFIIVIQSSLPLLLMLSLVYSALVITKNVVHEKERKLKESMKMMGLSNWLHWAAWFIKCFVFLLIPMFICSLMLCLSFSSNGRKMLNHSDGYLIFIFLMLYATSGIMFCFFVSTLFYRANIAAAGAGVLWFLTYIPYFFLYNYWFTMSVKSKILACLDFQVAMSFGSYLIGQFEGQGQGVQWSNINQGVTIDDEFTFGHVLMMQVVDIIFYGLLTWYIEGVFPGEYGIPKKFYFPFSKKYWCNVQDFDEERIALTDCDDLENNRKAGEDDSFEEYPEDRKIGIQIQNLRKTFKTEAGIKQAVDDLSLNLYEGEITALLGHNGAGKTTTISMLTGLFPPTSGNAVVNGYDIIYNMDKIRGSLGICPQHNVLFDTLTVEEHLIFFATLKGMKSKQKIEEEVNRMIESIGLSDKRNAESRNLSGGMKRKLSVGNALIGDSKVVILDEPTSGMDVGARRFTWDLLQRERRGRTILLTTHFMDEADVLGDRIAIMASGKVQCYGSSLFLKKRYGVGYHMVMVKTPTCDPSQVQNLIENYVPTAQLESNIGLELSFILPSEYSNKFEELFTEIESNREELGIASYGASVTTLEEVFIKVGEEQDTQESRSHTALFRQLSGKDQDSTNGTALPTFDAASIPFYQPTYEKNTGWTLFFQRWKAMFYKKILHSKRHKWSLIAQLVVPTINVLLGLIVVRTFPNATASPPLAMNLGMFTKDQYIPYCSSTTSRICTNRTPFYNAFAKTLHTESNHAAPNSVNDGFNVTQYVLTKERRDLARFNLQYPVGFEAQQLGNQKYRITGWFNNEALHTSAVTLNLLANILLANFTNNEFTIKSRNYPLPPTTSQSTTDTRMNPVGFQIGLNQNFGMAFVAASFIVFLVQERSSKAKHLQFVSGVDPISYWTSSYLWDMINFMLPCLSIIILFAVFQQEGYKGESLGYIMILFITYGWAVIPMMYIFSYLFQVASTAFVRMTILNILTGLATLLVVYILSIPSIGLVDVAHALKWAFLIFPNYNLGQAMIDLFNNYEFKHVFESEDPVAMCTQFLRHVPGAGQIPSQLIKQMCNESLLSYDSSIGRIDVPTCIKDDLTIFPNQKLVTQLCNGIQNFLINATSNFQYNYLAWDNPGIGRYLIFLALEGFIFFGIVLMIEYRVVGGLYIKIRSSLARLCNCSPVYVPTRDDCYFDADVTNEKTRINNQMANNHVLMMKNLTKVFHPRSGEPLLAVDHLSLGIPHGECFGLLGQNGAGKTTTFKILTGDETMTSGSASIDGFDVFRDVAEVRQRMGYCPQFDALIDLMTGRELLWMYCRLRGVPEQAISDTVNKLAKDLSVYEHIDKCTKTYSGGNKRKLSTAIALCGDPTLIFLDEPSSGMDPVARRMLWNSLSQVIVSGKSIVITSHSMEECEALCTRLAIMVNGQFKCLGSAQHLKNKFGEGYTLIAKVGGMNFDTLPLRHFIQATFPGSLLKDEHQGYIHYQLKTDQSWAQLFGIMERAKQQYNIEDYSVSQTTLEQVFLNFTREQRETED